MISRLFNKLVVGVILFSLGILLQLFLSGVVSWGELEARLYAAQTGSFDLDLDCPIMLSPFEAGTVGAKITNLIDEDTSPVITADISSRSGDQQQSQTLSLAPHETKSIHWNVDASNILFGRLILVNITQAPYRDLSSRQGACGIFILSLLGLNGGVSFGILFILSLLGISTGAWLWRKESSPLDNPAGSVTTAGSVNMDAGFHCCFKYSLSVLRKTYPVYGKKFNLIFCHSNP